MTSTIYLLTNCANVLFDSDTTHSFMSTICKTASISTKPLGKNISVAPPIGRAILCMRVVKNCPINIEGWTLLVNLVLVKMLGFLSSLISIVYQSTKQVLISNKMNLAEHVCKL